MELTLAEFRQQVTDKPEQEWRCPKCGSIAAFKEQARSQRGRNSQSRPMETLPGCDPREVFPGAAHLRSLPHRGQDEQGVGRGPRRRITQEVKALTDGKVIIVDYPARRDFVSDALHKDV